MKEIEIDSREFDVINLPSKGVFYKDGKKSLLIRYLTGIEEKVLTSEFLHRQGKSIPLVLKSVIMDDFDPMDLVISDYQGILMFLYSTAWGDSVNLNIKCENCYNNTEHSVRLSSLEFKKTDLIPEEGFYKFYIPYKDFYGNNNFDPVVIDVEGDRFVEIKIKPLTLRDEIKYQSDESEKSSIRKKIIDSIFSFGEIRNKEYVKKIISTMRLSDFNKVRKFFLETEMGVENNIKFSCPTCYHESNQKFGVGNDFLKLPDTHLKNVKEECFLISHYSDRGVSYNEAMNMSISERKWYIIRLQEELEKKRKAEDNAVQRAKSQSKSRR